MCNLTEELLRMLGFGISLVDIVMVYLVKHDLILNCNFAQQFLFNTYQKNYIVLIQRNSWDYTTVVKKENLTLNHACEIANDDNVC